MGLSKLEAIVEEVSKSPLDLRAEALIASLVGPRMELTDFVVAFEGQLQRIWSKDVAGTSFENLETGDDLICFHINRDGIFDTLPEALFLGNKEKESRDASEMARDSMRLRKEEKEARLFFQPFENELFTQRVQLVLKEDQLHREILSRMIMGILPDFWRIPRGLPSDYVNRMVRLLPLVHRISGNFNLTARSLEYITGEETAVYLDTCDELTDDHPGGYGILGRSTLGIDAVCGNRVNGFIGKLKVAIGPLRNRLTGSFIRDRRMDAFLECFYGYFIPVEYDVETRFILTGDDHFFLPEEGDGEKFTYLGYNSILA